MLGKQKSPKQGGTQVVEINEGVHVDTNTGEILEETFLLDDQLPPDDFTDFLPGDEAQTVPDDFSQLSGSEKRSRAQRGQSQ